MIRDEEAIKVMEELIKDTYIPVTFRTIFKQYIKWQEKNCRCCGCKDGHTPKCTEV